MFVVATTRKFDMPHFSGVLPVVPTPFTRDNAVDLVSLCRIVDYALECGVKAFVYPGVASEDVQLSSEERRMCVDAVTKRAKGKAEVIAGINSPDIGEMVELAKTMKEFDVNGIMAMAVPSMADRGYVKSFQDIAEASGGVPIILQNLFGPRGADLNAEAMLELAKEVDAIRYVKEEGIPSGPKVTALISGAEDELDGVIGGGGARYVFEELDRGVLATMPAIELLELHVALMIRYVSDDRKAAFDLYQRSLPLLLKQAPYRMRLTKLILKHRGIIETDLVREKLPEMDDLSKKLVIEMYSALKAETNVF